MKIQIPDIASIYNSTGQGTTRSAIGGIRDDEGLEPGKILTVVDCEGVVRGTFKVSLVDSVGNLIFSADMLPEGTTSGDYLIDFAS